MSIQPSAETIRNTILSATTPHVLQNVTLQWLCFKQTLAEWCTEFTTATNYVRFDCGRLHHNRHPQWERHRTSTLMTPTEFLTKYGDNEKQSNWATHSYKDIRKLPAKCREGITFERLGFFNLDDISFWLGSAGAHTPCHYDTYGYNIVVQVYGRFVVMKYINN